MVTTPLRALLLIAGVLIVGAAVYWSGVFHPQTEKASAVADAPAQPTEVRSGATAGDAAEGGATTAMAGADIASGQEKVVVPAFDLLRAEPDGSLVIAGRAEAGSEVEIVSGSSVLARTTTGLGGDFAAVLDDPLKPGEHNIVLRSTSKDNVAATSLETAVVSIPTAESGQVVALVQQPGEPSRLITAPEAGQQPPGMSGGQTMAEAGKGGDGARSGPAGAAEPTGGQATGDEGAPAEIAEAKPNAEPGRDGDAAGGAGQAASDAAAPATESSAGDTSQDVAPFIEAVEIDGRDVFAAGRAAPGRLVRVYANDILLGQTIASPEGRFLIEAERELPVGDYIIRADVLAEDGATVIARAAVPFERHQGEKIAAVAPARRQGDGWPRADGRASAGGSDGRPAAAANGSPAGDGSTAGGSTGAGQAGGGSAMMQATPRTSAEVASASLDALQGAAGEAGVSPALEPVDGAVIIRRGDTLWEISRRVYGRGVRYTTIYLANQNQINDPDRIWPGQIFSLPDETNEGEKADLGAIGEQAVKPETAAQKAAE
ncbi:LysM peptidoglycan-binding domain-containing protein [Chelativorans sp. AA-79]|uniref:LysM peptidoglycan-binding domain-containing protein n=1 Tax=Chelativorans sp. AA-79 TaxID=3028735 RepID=UPI0023F8D0AD|nr:LysM peptidoglycan-binding domain-containing protein [Chelativorans sp. AA-79]WEX07650.1 LysM peptidoglycan-binding domain-containing protein [Chelativorans sp. AA-79]